MYTYSFVDIVGENSYVDLKLVYEYHGCYTFKASMKTGHIVSVTMECFYTHVPQHSALTQQQHLEFYVENSEFQVMFKIIQK